MNKRAFVAISISALSITLAVDAEAQDTLSVRLDKAESLLLGHISPPDQTVDTRLEALEMNLYGKAKHGNVAKRMDSISQFLGIKDGSPTTASIPASAPVKEKPTDVSGNDQSAHGRSDNDSDEASSSGNSLRASTPQAPASHASLPQSPASNQNLPETSASHASLPQTPAPQTPVPQTPKAQTPKAQTNTPASLTKSANNGKIAPLKLQEAKMATPALSKSKSSTISASKVNDSVPPNATSLGKPVNSSLTAQAKELLREGIRMNASGQYREAETIFRRVLTVDPRNADAFYNLGSLAERNHDYVMALTNYRAALNFNPKDKDYISAVNAMEAQLSASTNSDAKRSSIPKLDLSDPALLNQNTTRVGNFQVPLDVTASPSLAASAGQPFQLSGSKNDVIMNTTQFNNQYVPTIGVNQHAPPPTIGVSQKPPKKKGTLSTVMGVGVRAALYSSGLHCPICRMTGGGFHF